MKLAKLSLAAMVVAGLASSSFAADTLADAFKNGKVSGELRAWYWDMEGSSTKAKDSSASKDVDADIVNVGVILGYVTDSFYGFKLGATVQSNYAPFADSDAKADFASDEYGSGAVLSEAYVQYSLGKTTATIGRQFITTPLVAGSGSRMIKQSFEGATLVNTDLPATTLVAGIVTKYQARTNGAGDVGEFNSIAKVSNKAIPGFIKGLGAKKLPDGSDIPSSIAVLDDGDYAYTLAAINKSLPGTTLTAQWAEVVNLVDMYYLEAAYEGKAGEFSYGLAGNYQYADYDSDIDNVLKEYDLASDGGQMFGVKLSLGYGDFKSFVAYTKITDDNALGIQGLDGGSGLGGSANTAFAQARQAKTGTYEADSEAYTVDANYNFKQIGLLVGARYTDVSVDSAAAKAAKTEDRGYTDIYTTYTFSGALKGFAADVSYQDWSKDVEGHEFWFKANYKF